MLWAGSFAPLFFVAFSASETLDAADTCKVRGTGTRAPVDARLKADGAANRDVDFSGQAALRRLWVAPGRCCMQVEFIAVSAPLYDTIPVPK